MFLCDIITNGAVLNPAMSISLYVNGDITFTKSLLLSLAQYLAGSIAFILLKLCIPIMEIEGPNKFINGASRRDIIEGAYQEGVGMMIFTIVVLAAAKYIKSANMNRAITAITLRVLTIINTKTGAWLNPMMGFGWIVFLAGSIGSRTLTANNPTLFVYCLAPSIGACVGTIVFAVLEYMMPSSSSSTKQDIKVSPPPVKLIRESALFSPKQTIHRISGATPSPLKTPKPSRGRSKSPASSKRKSTRSKTPSKKR